MLALLHQTLADPEAYRDPHGVETNRGNLLDVGLRGPRLPVAFEGLVGGVLADARDAGPLVVVVAAAHALPRGLGHPALDDEVAAEVDAADFARGGEAALC